MSTKPVPDGSTETDEHSRRSIAERANERVPTAIPDDDTPAARCPYCTRPFATEQLCVLHLGERHREQWTDEQRERYERAYDAESNELFVFHLKVIGALVGTFFAFTYTYAFVWS
ncbi:DUF7410 domain-containing protein [Halocatena salina]|uniref:DUF7410 domain-containing protein n=1 Tax=Halocatena salina TaxID=2934340 RepID=A0A8U0A0G1_9EURY|nr:hypothetical protein [Halocatena salina]UPM42552.1 hypothetical protein MW046_11385 [Halocatena salina]